jgi:hypothetical protein
MKKILLAAFLILMTAVGQAQYKPVLFGLRVAGDLGWMNADAEDYEGGGVSPGFTWGFVGQFFLMENYAIQTGFNMNFVGGEIKYPSFQAVDGDTLFQKVDLSSDYNLKYIQIPLCLKMQTELTEELRLFGKIGIGTAFLLDAKAKDSYSFEDTDYEDERDASDQVTLMRESLIIGGGVEWVLKGSTALVFDLTYDNCFNDILNFDNLATDDQPKAFYNYLELGVGILF